MRRSIALLAALLCAGSVVALAPAPSHASGASCSLDPTGGTVNRSLAGRSYLLRIPAGLEGPEAPLLVSLHPLFYSASQQESSTGWSGYADTHGFIVAYPQGLLNSWNFPQNSYDVAFLRSVVDDIKASYCVDDDRVFSDG